MNHVETLLHPQAEIVESLNNDDVNHMGSEDRGVTAVQKAKEKMVHLKFSLHSFGLKFLLKVLPPRRKYSQPPGGATSVIILMEQPSHTQPYRSPSPFQQVCSPSPFQQVCSPSSFQQVHSPSSFQQVHSPSSFQPSPSPSPFQPSKTHPCQYQPKLGKTTVRENSKPVFGDNAEEDSHSSTKPSRQTIYPQSNLRGFSAIRAKQLVHLIYIDKLATYICQRINELPHGHQKQQRNI